MSPVPPPPPSAVRRLLVPKPLCRGAWTPPQGRAVRLGPGCAVNPKGKGSGLGPPAPYPRPPSRLHSPGAAGHGVHGGVAAQPLLVVNPDGSYGGNEGWAPSPVVLGVLGGQGAHPPSCRCSAGPANGPGLGGGPAAPGRRAGPGGSGARPVWGQRVRLGGGHTGRGQDGSHSPARSGGSPG